MNLVRLENRLIVISALTGVPTYDFNFELHFTCNHPYLFEHGELCVLRIGAIRDYTAEFNEKLEWGLRLVNTPEEHTLASELEHWYPIIQGLTPRSEIFEILPDASQIEERFSWPIFLKGSRQTSKHNPSLSIIHNAGQYDVAARLYQQDDILHWQKPVIRQFVRLLSVPGQVPGKINPSLEYRSFWWNGACVGLGQYWYQVPPYHCSDLLDGLAVAKEAVSRLKVPFIVVDFAKTADGRWIVIECNDAQESGYSGIAPRTLWSKILSDNW